MLQIQINGTLEGLKLTASAESGGLITENNVNTVRFTVTPDAAWDGCELYAVFSQLHTGCVRVRLDGDNGCTVPACAMTSAGWLYIGVYGDKTEDGESYRLNSTVSAVLLTEGAFREAPPAPSSAVTDYELLMTAIPSGGAAGELLAKASDGDFDTEWTPASGYILPEATASTLGGVIAGGGLTVVNGVLSADFSGEYADLTGKPSVMTGATASEAGASGFVPTPSAGDEDKVLTGAGVWNPMPSRQWKDDLLASGTLETGAPVSVDTGVTLARLREYGTFSFKLKGASGTSLSGVALKLKADAATPGATLSFTSGSGFALWFEFVDDDRTVIRLASPSYIGTNTYIILGESATASDTWRITMTTGASQNQYTDASGCGGADRLFIVSASSPSIAYQWELRGLTT